MDFADVVDRLPVICSFCNVMSNLLGTYTYLVLSRYLDIVFCNISRRICDWFLFCACRLVQGWEGWHGELLLSTTYWLKLPNLAIESSSQVVIDKKSMSTKKYIIPVSNANMMRDEMIWKMLRPFRSLLSHKNLLEKSS